MTREQLEHYVAQIMDRFDGHGGTREYVDFVMQHDGQLRGFVSDLTRIGLEDIVKRLIRTDRLPEHGNVRRYASVQVSTGEVNDEGEEITKRIYLPAQKILFDKEDYLCDQVVDYHIRRTSYHQREANRWVHQRRIANPKYQRELPFSEFEVSEI